VVAPLSSFVRQLSTLPSPSASVRRVRSCPWREERDEGVGLAVAVAVALCFEPALGVVEVPVIDAPVSVLVQFDALELACGVVLDAIGPALALALDQLAQEHAVLVDGLRLEAAVEVGVALLLAQLLSVGLVDEDRVGLAVAVLVFFLARAFPTRVVDEGVALAVAVGVGLGLQLGVAVVPGLEVDRAVVVGVLLLARLLAGRVQAPQLDAPVVVGIEGLALARAVRREDRHHLRPSIAVLVAQLAPLDAVLVARAGVETPVAVRVGAAAGDLSPRVFGDEVRPAVAVAVLFDARLLTIRESDAGVDAAIAVGVLALERLLPVGAELGVQLRLAVPVRVVVDDRGLAVRVLDAPVHPAVAVRVLFATCRLAGLVPGARLRPAVEVEVVLLQGGRAARELDPLVGLAVAVGVLLLASRLPVRAVGELGVHTPVVVRVLLGAHGLALLEEHVLVVAAVAVRVGALLLHVLLLVEEQHHRRRLLLRAHGQGGQCGQRREAERHERGGESGPSSRLQTFPG
jgi:hypothetical protein